MVSAGRCPTILTDITHASRRSLNFDNIAGYETKAMFDVDGDTYELSSLRVSAGFAHLLTGIRRGDSLLFH